RGRVALVDRDRLQCRVLRHGTSCYRNNSYKRPAGAGWRHFLFVKRLQMCHNVSFNVGGRSAELVAASARRAGAAESLLPCARIPGMLVENFSVSTLTCLRSISRLHSAIGPSLGDRPKNTSSTSSGTTRVMPSEPVTLAPTSLPSFSS